MSKLYPIGDITAASSLGTIDGIGYKQFEPNLKITSSRKYTTLVSTFESQFKQTRKKAEPYINIKYDYENLFSREFRQIEHFVDSVEGSLTSFLAIDWSKGTTPTNVSSGWVVSMDDTTLYSLYRGSGASQAFLWTGTYWKLGTVTAITANTSITLSVSEGTLTYTEATARANVYPIYDVFKIEDPSGGFQMSQFVPLEDITLNDEGGPMYTGSVSFVGKYKI